MSISKQTIENAECGMRNAECTAPPAESEGGGGGILNKNKGSGDVPIATKRQMPDGSVYLRIPIKTAILKAGDDFADIINTYAKPHLQDGDIITISESPLAITQGRAINEKDIKVGFLAKILWRFVAKVPYGIGLRSPTSMQCAIDECGSLRILFAAIVGGFSKLILRRKGDFYRLAGKQAALIDAAHTTTVDGYQACVIKGPLHPEKAAAELAERTGYQIAIMDINDIGGSWCIGHSSEIDPTLIQDIMRDNPQGQGDELTPICIVRRYSPHTPPHEAKQEGKTEEGKP